MAENNPLENKRIQELTDGGTAQDGDFFPVARQNPDTGEWSDLKVQLPEFGSRMGTFFYQSPSNLTVTLIASARYAFDVTGLFGLKTATGSLTLSIQVNGMAIAGLSNIAVTSTAQDIAAESTIEIGDRLTVVISGVSGASGLEFTMY